MTEEPLNCPNKSPLRRCALLLEHQILYLQVGISSQQEC